jgi:hypothetical protein
MTLTEWAIAKLECVKEAHCVIIRDPLRLLPEKDGVVHSYAVEQGFTVITASTNLVFRELLSQAKSDPGVKKIVFVDRAPADRKLPGAQLKAPPPFYPDLAMDAKKCAIELDLRGYLRERTGDPHWPKEANDPRYARLIVPNIEKVIEAHGNLRRHQANRFTDDDFRTIVAYAALGIPDAAFKRLEGKYLWRIGLLGHETLRELESLAPELTRSLTEKLGKAKPPFCWLMSHEPEAVLRAFYLSVILVHHTPDWSLLPANVDSDLGRYSKIDREILMEAAPELVSLNPRQAHRDLEAMEESLTKEALEFLLVKRLDIKKPEGFASLIERERYSTLFRSLALLMALENLLSPVPAVEALNRARDAIFPGTPRPDFIFIDSRPSPSWENLKRAYRLVLRIRGASRELSEGVKAIKATDPAKLSLQAFAGLWNGKKVNRLEYWLSAAERLIDNAILLPRAEDALPDAFPQALAKIRERLRVIASDVTKRIAELNERFRDFIALRYPAWIRQDGEAYLTCQFLRRVLKPHWDPHTEKAAVLIFDGMRYDIWEEFLRPMLEDRLELVSDLPGCSLLPSETHITRKAISAGACPDEFNSKMGEDKLLAEGLKKAMGLDVHVETLSPPGAGTGEVVRYRAGNLEVCIFELCDGELHKIQAKTLQDGRVAPARPLAFIYQHHIKTILENEVMAYVRGLSQGTKVFITADHGFGPLSRTPIQVDADWLNEHMDCAYTNAWLRKSLKDAGAPAHVREKCVELTVEQLRMPAHESAFSHAKKSTVDKTYSTLIFPRAGYALSRPASKFNPDAFSHGGISLQELLVPMAVLKVRSREDGSLSLGACTAPAELREGDEMAVKLRVERKGKKGKDDEEVRAVFEATYAKGAQHLELPRITQFVPLRGAEVSFAFKPEVGDATDEERRAGAVDFTFTVTMRYDEGGRHFRKSCTHAFTVSLNNERIIRRVPSHLGSILGLAPKGMR